MKKVRLEGCTQTVGRSCVCGTESVPATHRLVEVSETFALDANRGAIVGAETVLREEFFGPECAVYVRQFCLNNDAAGAFSYRP